MSIKGGKEQMHEAIADMFERNVPNSDLAEEKLSIAIAHLESKNIDFTSASYDPSLFVLCVKFGAGIGRALINTVGDGKNDIEEIIDACIKEDVKPFNINEYQSPSMHESEQPFAYMSDDEGLRFDGLINKDWAIAITKALGVTGEDLL